MPRPARIASISIAVIVGVPLLVLAVAIAGANTGKGRLVLARAIASLSGGEVKVDGLSGRFPDALRAASITVGDASGVWLTIEQARVDWSPLRLIHGEAAIETVSAARVAVARLPASSASSSSGGSLPVRVTIGSFAIDRLDLAAPVASAAASVRVTGDLAFASSDDGHLTIAGKRLDQAGSYQITGSASPAGVAATVVVSEPEHGLISGLAGLPELGALSLSASFDGPRNDERLRFRAAAGAFTAEGHGKLDLGGKTIDLDLTAASPAMTPRPDLAWQSVRAEAHLHGPFTGPTATGRLDIEDLEAGGGSVRQVAADIRGDAGSVELTASATELRLPSAPDLFAAAPVELHARALLNEPRRPVSFTVSHPLLAASGDIDTAGGLSGSAALRLVSLAPYAAIAGVDLQGRAELTSRFAQGSDDAVKFSVGGTIGLTGGLPTAVSLLGDKATLVLTGALHGSDVTLDNLALDGKALSASAKGTRGGDGIDLDWQATLSDLSALSPRAAGTLSAEGHLTGPLGDFSATARLTGTAAVAGTSKDTFAVTLAAQGLPGTPSGKIEAEGRFAGAPLRLSATAQRDTDGTLSLALDRLLWKGVGGEGKLAWTPGSTLPLGRLQLRVAQLEDLAPFVGLPAKGGLDAVLETSEQQGRPALRLHAAARHLAIGDTAADTLTADAEIADPTTHPVVKASMSADGVRQGVLAGNAGLTADGPLDALGLRLTSNLRLPQGPATVTAAATARLPQRELQLASLDAGFDGTTARLLSPVRIDFAKGLAVDSLRLAVGGATVALAGRITPALALTVSAHNLTPATIEPLAPGLRAAGTLGFDGELRGTLAAPEGTLRLTGRGLKAMTASTGGLPAADIDATATLARGTARIDARLAAGSNVHLTLAGTAPLQPAQPLALRLNGNADLALLDPLLTPDGRAARGQATIDLSFGGTIAAPRASGTVRLANGDVQDFVQGIHVTDLTGLLRADGNTIRIDQLTGRAGSGTVSASGTLGILEPNMPVALTVTARQARLLASDLLNATTDADLTLRGDLAGTLSASGKIRVASANVNIPDGLPQGVAVLHVRRPGAKPRAAATPGPAVGLALTIDAPEQVFVRGHGIDAEMGGTLKVGGTAAAPTINGGFDLRHGTFSLLGQTLIFSSGKVSFGGSSLNGKLDPTLDFVAQTSASSIIATLTITGRADAPKLRLSSSPDLPQDEILGRMLFGQSTQQLSPFQIAEVAQAAASFSGIGGGDTIGNIRSKLGLDRLSVGSGSGSSSGATVEAGKYVANGVYVGAKQGTSGGSQAQVQVDLTKHLKVQTTLGTGGTPATGITPENDPGSSLGLTYSFDY
ncbi:MAG TPA: translocation/assembly module TamB domain-containing protein [Stellaceae bacterium]|jgi:translocation and assembly module TamB